MSGQREGRIRSAIERHVRLPPLRHHGGEWLRQRLAPLSIEFTFRSARFYFQVGPIVVWLLLQALGAHGYLKVS